MANVNFPSQQSSRNSATGSNTSSSQQSLSRNVFTSNSSSTSSSVAASHVTASTSNMFPGSSNSFSPQQLSPNRSSIHAQIGNRALFNQQRSFPGERRSVGSVGMQDWNSTSVGNLGSIGQSRTFSSHNNAGNAGNFQSMFNNANPSSMSCGSTSPPLLDLSEFPSLTNRGPNESSGSLPQQLNSAAPGKQPYGFYTRRRRSDAKVGMVKAPTTEQNEFMMSNEDFPALPGTQSTVTSDSAVSASTSSGVHSDKLNEPGGSIVDQHCMSPSSGSNRLGTTSAAPGAEKHQLQQQLQAQIMQPQSSQHAQQQQFALAQQQQRLQQLQQAQQQQEQQQRYQQAQQQLHTQYQQQQQQQQQSNANSQRLRCVQTFADGKVTNIPSNMMKDQFGILGLLTFIRAAESDKNVVSLALGQDLTALGLNLNSPGSLHPSFAGPWTAGPVKPQEVEYHVPPDYLTNQNAKLPDVNLHRYKEDLLFFLFYMFAGDTIQLAAAAELYNRDWRFHLEEKVWIYHTSLLGVMEKTATYERGMYYYFDAHNWKKVPKEFHLEYSKLEGRPVLPSI